MSPALQTLLSVIEKTVKPSAEDGELCAQYFEEQTVSRNTVLEEGGKVPRWLWFSVDGFLRLFHSDDNGEEQTSFLCSPPGFIASFLAFIHQTVSIDTVACITDSRLLRISHSNLKTLIDRSQNFQQFSLVIFEQAIRSVSDRANDLATLNAEQRYRKLLAQQPAIAQQVPVQYIASYLGMKPESLSRVRRGIIS